jgi:hypothetical protein
VSRNVDTAPIESLFNQSCASFFHHIVNAFREETRRGSDTQAVSSPDLRPVAVDQAASAASSSRSEHTSATSSLTSSAPGIVAHPCSATMSPRSHLLWACRSKLIRSPVAIQALVAVIRVSIASYFSVVALGSRLKVTSSRHASRAGAESKRVSKMASIGLEDYRHGCPHPRRLPRPVRA